MFGITIRRASPLKQISRPAAGLGVGRSGGGSYTDPFDRDTVTGEKRCCEAAAALPGDCCWRVRDRASFTFSMHQPLRLDDLL